MAVQLLRRVGRPRGRHLLCAVELKEHRLQRLDQGNVEPVHPDDALFGLIAVIVPGPTRRQYKISRLHIDTLAIDSGIGTASFNDEADRRRRVAVSTCYLSRQEHLYSGDEIVCRRPAPVEAWVEKLQCPALLAHGH